MKSHHRPLPSEPTPTRYVYRRQETTRLLTDSNSSPRTQLQADERLAVTLSLNVTGQTYADLFERIRRIAGVRLTFGADANSFRAVRLGIAGENISCRAVMDALASVPLCRWERVGETEYALREPNRSIAPAIRPERRDALAIAGLRLRDQIKALPSEMQKQLTAGKYLPFTSLPASVQKEITDLVAAWNQQEAGNPTVTSGRREVSLLSMRDLSSGEITFQTEPHPDVTRYRLFYRYPFDVDNNYRRGSILFEDSTERRQAEGRRSATGDRENIYAPKRFEISVAEARQRPELQRPVSAKARRMPFGQAVMHLCSQAKVPILYIVEQSPPLADVEMSPAPLVGALDQLTKLFPGYEWEYRPMGFVIVRKRTNSQRPQR